MVHGIHFISTVNPLCSSLPYTTSQLFLELRLTSLTVIKPGGPAVNLETQPAVSATSKPAAPWRRGGSRGAIEGLHSAAARLARRLEGRGGEGTFSESPGAVPPPCVSHRPPTHLRIRRVHGWPIVPHSEISPGTNLITYSYFQKPN